MISSWNKIDAGACIVEVKKNGSLNQNLKCAILTSTFQTKPSLNKLNQLCDSFIDKGMKGLIQKSIITTKGCFLSHFCNLLLQYTTGHLSLQRIFEPKKGTHFKASLRLSVSRVQQDYIVFSIDST